MKKKLISVVVLALAVMMVFTACSTNPASVNPSASSAAPASSAAASSAAPASSAAASSAAPASSAAATTAANKVSMSGSTSMEKVAKALAEDFMAKNKGVTVDVQLGGSSVGIQDATSGKVDIGNSSRALKDEEKAAGLVDHVICLDAVALIVNPKNGAVNVTKQQAIDIFTGKITNWKDVGGANKPIVVIGREASSGTRDAVESILGIKDKAKYAQELNESGAVITAVSTTENAIGYVSLDLVNTKVKPLTLDSVKADKDSVLSGKYLLQRPFVMATKGDKLANETAQKFLDYVLSDDGRAVIEKVGLILQPKK